MLQVRPSTNGFIWCLRDAFYDNNNPDSFNAALVTTSSLAGMAFNIFYPFVYIIYLSVQFAELLVSRTLRLLMLTGGEKKKKQPDVASNPCLSCKLKNRRKKRHCDYNVKEIAPHISEPSSDSFQEDYLAVHAPPSTSNPYTLPVSNFPALYFVDPPVFHNHHVEIPKPSDRLPSYVVGELGSALQHEFIGRLFFHTIHRWFPMISRKRFYEELHEASEGPGVAADFGCLLLAMKLMTWRPPSLEGDAPGGEGPNARTATYRAAKQFCFELEAAGMVSLRVLQGMLLVALYEVGHAIYPAAFMSVAACVRYAHALGIQPGGMQRLKLPLTWVEAEERKRVWWSAFLLDRIVSLNCPGCPAAIDEPGPQEVLPTDDALWDEGVSIIPQPRTVDVANVRLQAAEEPSSPLLNKPVSMEFGRFALLTQAFVLLSKVLKLKSTSPETSTKALKDEAQRLERTIKALLYFGQMEVKSRNGMPSFELHSVCTISLITLYTSPKIPIDMPIRFIESLADLLNSSNYEHLVTAARRGRDEISPFLIQLLYQTCVLLLKTEHPKNGDWSDTRVEKLRSALRESRD
ncbi:fungal-specific transcription factor domain-containing protein [Trichoderma citrinoviride]|uniref:Fungal-specific transcription factor domain-containing protein n=1 Tax=Trichoderma citrinoviride TaxID=58853 RepID=A0A2T4BGN4_9HYPO|nr:fungal-specific transcription factor domain-containing protein [Trichoderma citrinoviride]PTB68483.1 fungal-specific transcription factor domain-containing protein [Trichoderma citrinoviride]